MTLKKVKLSALLLAGWYLLSASCALPVLLDRFAPLTKVVASADFPCAHHDCACRDAEQCRLHCCCFPKRAPAHGAHADAPPREVPVTRLAVAQCSGHAPEGTVAGPDRLLPHLPPAVSLARASLTVRRVLPERPDAHALLFVDPPEKVPLPSRA